MSYQVERLRFEANRCRDMASRTFTASTRKMLEEMALQFDAEADKLERGGPAPEVPNAGPETRQP